MADPRQAAASLAAIRRPRWERFVGLSLAVVAWAVASDGRWALAALSVVAALLIRGVYVVAVSWGAGRSTFWSAWFFAIAAICEVGWLIVR